MRLCVLKIRNFRCYRDEVAVDFDGLTALIGKNDSGKSTLLEALAIFFDAQKPDCDDAAVSGNKSDMLIACEFDSLPQSLVIDTSSTTSLDQEYLLNKDRRLEIRRVYNGSLKTPSCKVFIRAVHPSAENVKDLLVLKNSDLKVRAKVVGADLNGVDQKSNVALRQAIRSAVGDLVLEERDIEVDTAPGAKELYSRIKEALPAFFLFRSDRPSTDQDSEAQDPMKVAVKLAIEQQREDLERIALAVRGQVEELVSKTLAKVAAMAPEIADELTPNISDPKWDSIFKISLSSDAAVPLNKRGSGVRRLVLLGFLQAQAEAYRLKSPDCGIIYAIEEPETSQHPDKQRALLDAIEEIAEQAGYQVLITTHTPMLGRLLPASTLRYVEVLDDGSRTVQPSGEETMRRVAKALGVLPDHDVQVFVGVEGKHDEAFLKALSSTLSKDDDLIDSLEDLETLGKLIFIPVGGSNVGLWVSRLHHLDRPEFHIFDRDHQPPSAPHYAAEAEKINARAKCTAVHTSKRELENYLHPDAIRLARPNVDLGSIDDFDDVPELAARKLHEVSESSYGWAELDEGKRGSKASNAKRWLNKDAAARMTRQMLADSDTANEVIGWLRKITELARGGN